MPETKTQRPEMTDRQREVYEVIRRGCLQFRSPTVREIGEELGIASPNGVLCHIKALLRDGHITADGFLSRSYRPTELPCPHCGKDLMDV